MTPARYDGHADWYDEHIAAYSATAAPLLLRLVGAGPAGASMWAAGLAPIWPPWKARDGPWSAWMRPPISSGWPGIDPGR